MLSKLVSIIVPVYNVKDCLQRCVDSVTGQTYHNLEIILVDDGSDDGSDVICDKAALTDTRTSVIHKANGGVSSARNAGIDVAHGEYICFCDADDVYAPYFVETLLSVCEQYNASIAIGGYERFSKEIIFKKKDKINIQTYSNVDATKKLIGKEHIAYTLVNNKLYRKSVFARERFQENIIHEDEEIMYRLLYNADGVAVTNEIVYGYYTRENSIMTSDYSIRRTHFLRIAKDRALYFREKGEKNLYEETMWVYAAALLTHYPRVKKDLKMKKLSKEIIKEYNTITPYLLKATTLPLRKKMVIAVFKVIPGAYAGLMRLRHKFYQC